MPELCGKMSLALWRISGLRATKGSGLRGSISGGDKRAVKLSSLPLSAVFAWRVCRIQSASVYAQCLKVFLAWSVTMGQPGTEAFSFFQSREKQRVFTQPHQLNIHWCWRIHTMDLGCSVSCSGILLSSVLPGAPAAAFTLSHSAFPNVWLCVPWVLSVCCSPFAGGVEEQFPVPW